MGDRIAVTLCGGPMDETVILPPDGVIEAGFECDGRVAVYRIKGAAGIFLGFRPMSWLTDDDETPEAEEVLRG